MLSFLAYRCNSLWQKRRYPLAAVRRSPSTRQANKSRQKFDAISTVIHANRPRRPTWRPFFATANATVAVARPHAGSSGDRRQRRVFRCQQQRQLTRARARTLKQCARRSATVAQQQRRRRRTRRRSAREREARVCALALRERARAPSAAPHFAIELSNAPHMSGFLCGRVPLHIFLLAHAYVGQFAEARVVLRRQKARASLWRRLLSPFSPSLLLCHQLGFCQKRGPRAPPISNNVEAKKTKSKACYKDISPIYKICFARI